MSKDRCVTDVIEEDWSHLMSSFTGTHFSNHKLSKIPLSPSVVMEIACVEHLTPLDMISLSCGTSDSTGNRIWMGAYAFIELFVKPIKLLDPKEDEPQWSEMAHQLCQLRRKLFHNSNIVELGAGTGISGISVAMAYNCEIDERFTYRPKQITLTDNDANVLDLCKRNCELNLSKDSTESGNGVAYEVSYLEWGIQPSEREMFNTVIATDVIYNLASLEPLFQTSHDLLVPGGCFILSHVPRASIISDFEPRVALENEILETARKNQFESFLLVNADEYNQLSMRQTKYGLRPDHFKNVLWYRSANMEFNIRKMESVGVTVFIFIKISK